MTGDTRSKPPSDGPPLRIAHAYGNSRKSLRRALSASIDMIEVDIWLRGNDIVVRHDRRLDPFPLLVDRRMRGHALAPLRLPICRGYYIRPDVLPLKLVEVMKMVASTRRLLVDVKGDYKPRGIDAFARAIVREIERHDARDWVSVCGQYWPVLDRLREVAPQIEVRYSIEKLHQWEKFLTLLPRGDLIPRICIEHRFLDEQRARFIKEHGIEIYCWTVDDPGEAARLVEGGVDGIISNDLDLLAELGLKRPA